MTTSSHNNNRSAFGIEGPGRKPPYKRGEPLTTHAAVHEMLEFFLGSATERQMWLFSFDTRGALMELIMPFGELPGSPDVEVDTSDLGRVSFARVLSDRIRSIGEMTNAASCALAWERLGSERLTLEDLTWARDFERHLAAENVTVRAQFVLNDTGLREITSADLDV